MRSSRLPLVLAAGSLLLAPVFCRGQEGLPAVSPGMPDSDSGVLYNPRADYEQGAFDAEEEILSNAPAFWVMVFTNTPPQTNAATGLPVKHLLVDPGEPWHKKCMAERIRGHNEAILRSLAGAGLLPQPTENASTSTNAPAIRGQTPHPAAD